MMRRALRQLEAAVPYAALLLLFMAISSLGSCARAVDPLAQARARAAQQRTDAAAVAAEIETQVQQASAVARAAEARRTAEVQAAALRFMVQAATATLLLLLAAVAAVAAAYAVRAWRATLQLPPSRNLDRLRPTLLPGSVFDPATGMSLLHGTAQLPLEAQARALATVLQTQHNLPRRYALPQAWEIVTQRSLTTEVE